MVSGTRSKRTITSNPERTSRTSKTSKTSKTSSTRNQNARKKQTAGTAADLLNQEESNLEDDDPDFENDDEDTHTQEVPKSPNTNRTENIFCSRFPSLELDTFQDQLDQWTIVQLRDAIVKQDSRRSSAHKDIKDLVKLIRMDFEKRVLMVALMAGVPEVVIWNLM